MLLGQLPLRPARAPRSPGPPRGAARPARGRRRDRGSRTSPSSPCRRGRHAYGSIGHAEGESPVNREGASISTECTSARLSRRQTGALPGHRGPRVARLSRCPAYFHGSRATGQAAGATTARFPQSRPADLRIRTDRGPGRRSPCAMRQPRILVVDRRRPRPACPMPGSWPGSSRWSLRVEPTVEAKPVDSARR
jgi:hypothetical protein